MNQPPLTPGSLSKHAKALLGSGDHSELDFDQGCIHILREFDGWEGLAREVKMCFESTETSPSVRANLLKNVLGIFETQARINKDNRPSESTMTDEELLEQAAPLLSAFNSSLPPVEAPTALPNLRDDDIPAPAPQAPAESDSAPAV